MKGESDTVQMWSRFLTGNLESAAQEYTGETPGVDDLELLIDVLPTQSVLHNGAIEAGIIDWADTWKRPRFDTELQYYFVLRLALATDVVRAIGDASLNIDLTGPPPALSDHGRFLKWILIDAWHGLCDKWPPRKPRRGKYQKGNAQ